VRARTAGPGTGLVLQDVGHSVQKADLSRTVSDLEAQVDAMKRQALVQAAETKAAMVSLREKLVFAQEKEAETEGELEVSEEHVKDLTKQLKEAKARAPAAPMSFLQLASASEDELAATQKELAEVKSKIRAAQQSGRDANAKLAIESRSVLVTQRELSQFRERNKRLEKEAKRSDAAFLKAQQKLGAPDAVAFASGGAHQALATARKIGAAKEEVQQLQMDRAELLAKLSSQQQALEKMNFEIKQHSDNVARLRERSENLEEIMTNMDKADAVQVDKATQESQRIQSFFASMNKEIQKAKDKKADLDARIASLQSQRSREELRAKNQAEEAREVANEVEQANSELHSVREEINKLHSQIGEQQQKEEKMKGELLKERIRYQQELKDKTIRDQQIDGLATELAAKSKEASSLEAQYIKLQRKERAAKRLLEKEKAKAKEQELAAQKQIEQEKEHAEEQVKEDAKKLQHVQEMLQKEAILAKEGFDEEVKQVEARHKKEVQEQEHKIAQQVELEKGQVAEKVAHLEVELRHEQKIARDQAAAAAQKEEEMRRELKKTKEAEEEKVRAYRKSMTDLEASLQEQRKASMGKVQEAKLSLQQVQDEVVAVEQALAAKKEELARVEKEAKSAEERANLAEHQEQEQEKHLQAKLQAANLMERRGKTALQRQAEHQAAKLRKMIQDEKAMEQEQVSELEAEIRQAEVQAGNSTTKVKVHAKFLRAK